MQSSIIHPLGKDSYDATGVMDQSSQVKFLSKKDKKNTVHDDGELRIADDDNDEIYDVYKNRIDAKNMPPGVQGG